MFAEKPPRELSQRGIAFILPIYAAFDYSRVAAESFFARTPERLNPICLVLDDASPGYDKVDWSDWYAGLPQERCFHFHYPENGGLTRSWNYGLKLAREFGCDYAIAGNSDVMFTEGWHLGLKHVLDADILKLAGPVTNAPGRTDRNRQHQNVRNFVPNYKVSDDPHDIQTVSSYLLRRYAPSEVVLRDVNGFFMMARTQTWFDGAFDDKHVFDPKNKMVGNEDELVKRWNKKGWPIGFVPSSYIFHYRSVSRVVKGIDVGRHRFKDPPKLTP